MILRVRNPMNHPKLFDLSAVIAGGLLPLAFAPLGWYPFAIIALMVLLWIWLESDPKRAFWRGWLFGLGLFGVGISWVFVSIHEFGNTNVVIAGMLTALFVMFLALFLAVQAWCFSKFLPKNSMSQCLLGFPAIWVLFEFFRSWVLTGLPWLLLGYSQVSSPLKGYIPILGVFGVSFLLALTAGLCVTMLRKRSWMSAMTILLIWGGGSLLSTIHWTEPFAAPMKVSLVQGNIPQQTKWSPDYLEKSLQTYVDLTREHWSSQLIVWPEAAIPLPLRQAKGLIDSLNVEASLSRSTLITGIPVHAKNYFDSYYNAMIVIGGNGGMYFKRHLVPFGEYLPFEQWLRGLIGFFNLPMSSFISGPDKQPDMRVNNIIIAPFICYEIAYAQEFYHSVLKSNLLLVMSNDAWFGDSWASAQHLQIAQARALQSGRYLLFDTNNGITAIIKPNGEIQTQAPQFKKTVLTSEVRAMKGNTPWMHLGVYPILLAIGFLLLIALVRRNTD